MSKRHLFLASLWLVSTAASAAELKKEFVAMTHTVVEYSCPIKISKYVDDAFTTLLNSEAEAKYDTTEGTTLDVTPRAKGTFYTSSNPLVADVSQDGLVTVTAGFANGSAARVVIMGSRLEFLPVAD